MKNMQTPLHKVQGLGSSHSGTGHFRHERLTAVALIPLTLWFGWAMLGLANASAIDAIGFFAHPLNAILMTTFIVISLYHVKLGLQVIIDDYVHAPGKKIFLLLLVWLLVLATGSLSLFATLRLVS